MAAYYVAAYKKRLPNQVKKKLQRVYQKDSFSWFSTFLAAWSGQIGRLLMSLLKTWEKRVVDIFMCYAICIWAASRKTSL